MGRPSFLYADPASGGGLYVGGRQYDESTLDALGVTVVLAAVEPPAFVAMREDIAVLRCPFSDRADARPDPATLRRTTREAAWSVTAGRAVLVHCERGYNRGPYLAALVLRELGHSPAEAVRLLLDRHHRQVLHNEGLARALIGRHIRDEERRGHRRQGVAARPFGGGAPPPPSRSGQNGSKQS